VYGAFVSSLKILKKLLCPLPCTGCLIKGASAEPNLDVVPNKESPKIAGSFVSNETSLGCILSGVSKSNLTLNVDLLLLLVLKIL